MHHDADDHDAPPRATPGLAGWLDAGETADILKVPVGRLKGWRRRRYGPPAHLISPTIVRYRRAEVDAWAASHRVDPERRVSGDG